MLATIDGEQTRPNFYSILIHNVSHHDFVLALRGKNGENIMAQPKFNEVQEVSKRIFERYFGENKEQAPGIEEACFPSALTFGDTSECPYGWNLKESLSFDSYNKFSLKSSTAELRDTEGVNMTGFYLPLVAVLVRRWLCICADRHPPNSTKILYLLSGYAMPWNPEHSPQGNSTKFVGELIIKFCQQFYPEVRVELVNSGVEIFHYDANVTFINQELRPKLEQHRRRLADLYEDKWATKMHVVVTLTAGSPARMSALHASMRAFKPDSLHMWQLKTFWHEFPAVSERAETDVEFHRFQKIEMTPAVPVWKLDPHLQALVTEMKNLKATFESTRDGAHNELANFWLRKSKLPVLAVLMILKKGQDKPTFVRGINMEVSLPTGSLCAERNAIGTALTNDPTLLRKDLRAIAVMVHNLQSKGRPSLPSPSRGPLSPLALPPSYSASLVSPSSASSASSSSSGSPVSPLSSPREPPLSPTEPDQLAPLSIPGSSPSVTKRGRSNSEDSSEAFPSPTQNPPSPLCISPRRPDSPRPFERPNGAVAKKPRWNPSAYSSDSTHTPGHVTNAKSFCVASGPKDFQEEMDMNPIDPCGSCSEWIKKIAEVNPDFKVLTFTSSACNEAFIKQCAVTGLSEF